MSPALHCPICHSEKVVVERVLAHRSQATTLSGGDAAFWTTRAVIPAIGLLVLFLIVTGISGLDTALINILISFGAFLVATSAVTAFQRRMYRRQTQFHCYGCQWTDTALAAPRAEGLPEQSENDPSLITSH
jgi:hypothetical protein